MNPVWRVTVADATVGDEEIAAVGEVLRSRWLSAGARTRDFEGAFAARLGVPGAVAVSSGTAALHLAILALGVGRGDEVIMPSLSFVAAAEVTALHGGVPVFADVRSEHDLTVDPDHVRRLVTPRTRAIVAMHYGGHGADLAALAETARAHGVALIEDAAHAPVVTGPHGTLGTVGDLGCFSFFATKNVTTGEGGMVVARDPAVLDRIRAMRSHHLTAGTWERAHAATGGYDVPAIGLNYRPTEISSALGLVQLGRLDEERARRRAVVAVYRELLGGVPGLVTPFACRTGDSAYHLAVVLLPGGTDRDAVRTAMARRGVQTSVHYPPTHLFSYYRRYHDPAARPLPVTEDVAARILTLPLHARMTEDDAALVARALLDELR